MGREDPIVPHTGLLVPQSHLKTPFTINSCFFETKGPWGAHTPEFTRTRLHSAPQLQLVDVGLVGRRALGLVDKGKEVEIESIRKKLARAADTGYRMWHNA